MPSLEGLLNENEKVVWTGKPVRNPFILSTLGSIPIGLFFIGFSIFWTLTASQGGAPAFFALPGLILAVVGIGLIFGPSIWQLMRYRNTEYMITSKRIITQTGAIGLDTRFVDFDKIQEVYVKIGVIDRLFGTGSLYAMTAGIPDFAPQARYGYGGMQSVRPSLAALKEPYEVQKLLQEAVEKSRATKAQ